MRPLFCCALALVTSACEYDLDKIYRYAELDAGQHDASAPVPSHLIDLYSAHPFVDEDCQRCANQRCRAENDACRSDDACLTATSCYAQNIDPDTFAQCRSDQVSWFAAKLEERALGDPFYTCVFNDRCQNECASTTSWECLGDFTWNKTQRRAIDLELQYYEGRNGSPGADITTRVCSVLEETTCAGVAPVSDANGRVELELPTPSRSFLGYLELKGEGWYPTLVRFGWPMARDGVMRLGIVNAANIQANSWVTHTPIDEERGLLQLRIFGCGGLGMRDVSFSASLADDDSKTWYYDGETANLTIKATTDWGNGGIINVRPGLTRVDARRNGKLVASTVAPVRAGYLTIVILTPSSRM